jgi:filamentous hemagglutinin family protein
MKSHASMNRIYRLVWNAALKLWVAVAENAKGQGKSGSARNKAALLMLVPLSSLMHGAWAADAANATVSAGAASVTTAGNTTTINQASQRAAIDWTSLSTRANEALVFNQPNAQAIALNRITGSSPSELLGSLTANGQVFILNPNGVLFGAGSQVNVGGLVASTLSMSNADFMDGKHVFTGTGASGSVVNQGTLNAASGGYLALLAPEVRNEGVMTASLGTALLAAGNKVTLNLDNGSLLGYSIDQGAINALAENKQLIKADGGQVLLGAKALDSLTTATVNNTGVIEAKTLQNKAGRILLMGDMSYGTVNVAGTLDASAPTGGDGGFIETSAAHVKIADSAVITTKAAEGLGGQSGNWLIDPTDFTIAASGGDMTGAALSAQLANNGTVTILNTQGASGTAGDINVNDAVSWSSNSVLTLTAGRDININRAITATGASGGLRLNYGGAYKVNASITLSGVSASLRINNQAYTLVHSMSQLDLLDGNNAVTNAGTAVAANGFYALAQDLNAAGTAYTKSLLGATSSVAFGGTFAGLGHTISNLNINSTSGAGLFGLVTATGVIRDVGLVGGSITGGASGDVGALAGRNTGGAISNVYATTNVSGGSRTGGLVGFANGGSISNAWTSGTVSGVNSVGGLVGTNTGSISNAYAEGAVSGGFYTGGLVGTNNAGGSVSQAYATGAVNGTTGATTNGSRAGGLVGLNNGDIAHAYATGAVSGDYLVGGLIGNNAGTVDSVYATGGVTLVFNPNLSPGYAGGLMGSDTGSVSNGAWDSGSSGQSSSVGFNYSGYSGTDVTAATRYTHSAYGNLGSWTETAADSGVWVARDAGGNPQWVMVEGSTRPFLYSEWSANIGNAHQLQLMAADVSASYTLVRNIDASATRGTDAGGMWSAAGFASVGNSGANFNGRFDGQNRTVDGLTIVRSSADNVGLFGQTGAGSDIRNAGLTHVAISGKNGAGALVGNNGGAISNSYASGNVSASSGMAGGLVGQTGATSRISGSYATADVVALTSAAGGLVGYNLGNIDTSYASGTVGSGGTSVAELGGLVGSNAGRVTNSYATGAVNGAGPTQYLGGLVGSNGSTGYIGNSYATGAVGGSGGSVRYAGALVGFNNGGTVAASFWKNSVSATGIGQNSGGTVDAVTRGLAEAEFMNLATYSAAGWDIDAAGGTGKAWRIYEGNTGPLLRSFLTGLTLADTNTTYNGATQSGASSAAAGILGAASAGRNAGVYNGYYSGQQGYDIKGGSLTIAKANLNLSAVTDSKTYDGTAASSAAVGKTGLAAGDTVTGLAQSFGDKNVLGANGSTLAVNAGYVIADGNNGGNYNVILTTASGTINKATLTVTGVVADSKTYDASNAATLGNSGTLDGLVGGEVLTLTNTGATFADKNAGAGKLVTATYSLADGVGGLAGNYQLAATPVTTTANIDRAALTISGITAADKTYNANDVATVNTAGASYSGLFAGDAVNVNATGLFSDKNAGTGKTVTLGSTYTGADAGNYIITGQARTTASISQATLTISGITAGDKTYNASDAATVNTAGVSYNGLFAGDALTVAATGSFSDKNAGVNKTVNLSSSYSGADLGNYAITGQATTTASISQAALTISGITAGDKTYDAGTAATVNTAGVSYNGLFAGDVVNVSVTGLFSDKNAGTGKTVNLSSSYSGADAGNYAISSQTGTTATINKADLTVQATGTSKVYDGTTVANVAFSNNALAGDVLNVSSSASFADSNAGLNKTVSVTGIAVGGADAGNYNLISGSTAATTADITPKQLTVTANNDTQMGGAPYSGGNGVSYNGLVTGDTATAVLAGNLAYGGSAQGAYLAGEYDITPGGLLANGNYSLRFVQGRLTLSGGDAASVALGGAALVGAYQGALNSLSGDGVLAGAFLGGSKGKGGGDAAAAAINAAAAEASGQEGGN